MQLVNSLSKLIFLVVLSCALFLLTWNITSSPLPGPESLVNAEENTASASQDDDTIWDTMRRDFKLDHQPQSAAVQAEIRKLLSDQQKLYQILKAAGPYIYFIHQQTQLRGLPSELALIPVIESEFNPNDHSKKGATGLWQLMSGTANELGVKVKSSYDGRRNVVASTRAALAYFKDLGVMFKGNWYLAIAAYNCGQMRVASAEKRTGSTNFWNLPLPRETKYYVPKLLAVAEIVENPDKYGVQLPPVNNEPYFAQVKADKSINLSQIAKTSGINLSTLTTLNPDYNHGSNSVPKGKDGYSVLVPIDKVATVKNKLPEINSVNV